jgi:hypothetical protein
MWRGAPCSLRVGPRPRQPTDFRTHAHRRVNRAQHPHAPSQPCATPSRASTTSSKYRAGASACSSTLTATDLSNPSAEGRRVTCGNTVLEFQISILRFQTSKPPRLRVNVADSYRATPRQAVGRVNVGCRTHTALTRGSGETFSSLLTHICDTCTVQCHRRAGRGGTEWFGRAPRSTLTPRSKLAAPFAGLRSN